MLIKKEISICLPVCQNFHTGLWGFEKVNNALDLKKCIYKTEREAKLAREKYIKEIEAILVFDQNEYEKRINLGYHC
jgi:hypothetical protein